MESWEGRDRAESWEGGDKVESWEGGDKAESWEGSRRRHRVSVPRRSEGCGDEEGLGGRVLSRRFGPGGTAVLAGVSGRGATRGRGRGTGTGSDLWAGPGYRDGERPVGGWNYTFGKEDSRRSLTTTARTAPRETHTATRCSCIRVTSLRSQTSLLRTPVRVHFPVSSRSTPGPPRGPVGGVSTTRGSRPSTGEARGGPRPPREAGPPNPRLFPYPPTLTPDLRGVTAQGRRLVYQCVAGRGVPLVVSQGSSTDIRPLSGLPDDVCWLLPDTFVFAHSPRMFTFSLLRRVSPVALTCLLLVRLVGCPLRCP